MSTILYAKTAWENRDKANNKPGTKLNAEHMNNIEDGIEKLVEVVNAINPATGTGLTDEQLTLLTTVKTSLETVQKDLDTLKAKFEAHVHPNVVGDTTGEVIV